MEVTILRQNNAAHFQSLSENCRTLEVDGSIALNGVGEGMSPMEALLASVGTCAAIDVVAILEKQRQTLTDLKVKVRGERRDSPPPRPFTEIHIHFQIAGNVDEQKVAHAVELAVEQYCSVKESLDPSIPVTYSHEIIL